MKKSLMVFLLFACANLSWAVELSQVFELKEGTVAISESEGGIGLLDLVYSGTLPRGLQEVEFRFGTANLIWQPLVILPAKEAKLKLLRRIFDETDPKALKFHLESPGGEIPLRVSAPIQLGTNFEVSYNALISADERQFIELEEVAKLRNNAGAELPELTFFLPEGTEAAFAMKPAEERKLGIATWNNIPVHKTYTLDIAKRGTNPILKYVFKNDFAQRPLLPGLVRVFISKEEVARLLCSSSLNRCPTEEEAKLEIGPAPDIEGKRYLVAFDKQEHWESGTLCWTTTRETYRIEVENRRPEDVTVEVLERIPDVWKLLRSNILAKEIDAHTITFDLKVPAGERATVEYELQRLILGSRPAEPLQPFETLIAH